MVSKEDVIAAYRLILGREPDNDAVVALHVANCSSLSELRHALIGSHEFRTSRTIDGPIYVAGVPARYAQNRPVYEARGGLVRYEDANGFLSRSVAGDLPRYFFLTLSIDQIIKENIAGDFAELGVYRGATASILATMARRTGRSAYLFDTFEGFSERDLVGIDAAKGVEFADTSIEAVRALVGDVSVHFIKGYFPESASSIPETVTFSLVHIDCDLYAPFKHALEYFWPRLAPGGFMIMHDYSSLYWDGAEKAVDDFFADKAEMIILLPDTSGTVVARKNGVPRSHDNGSGGPTAEQRSEIARLNAERDRLAAEAARWFDAAIAAPAEEVLRRRPSLLRSGLKLMASAFSPGLSLVARAEAARAAQQWERAARFYLDALVEEPGERELWTRLAEMLDRAGRPAEAALARRRSAGYGVGL